MHRVSGERIMLMEAVFAIVGGLLMTSTAPAQGPAIGETCGQKTAHDSGHYCGAAPAKAQYTFTHTGIHDLAVAPNPDGDPPSHDILKPNQTELYNPDNGPNVSMVRPNAWLSERTLTRVIAAIHPCDACMPDSNFGGCRGSGPGTPHRSSDDGCARRGKRKSVVQTVLTRLKVGS
jgi:hypothetical protein